MNSLSLVVVVVVVVVAIVVLVMKASEWWYQIRYIQNFLFPAMSRFGWFALTKRTCEWLSAECPAERCCMSRLSLAVWPKMLHGKRLAGNSQVLWSQLQRWGLNDVEVGARWNPWVLKSRDLQKGGKKLLCCRVLLRHEKNTSCQGSCKKRCK